MTTSTSSNPCPKSAFLQSEPMQYLLQHRQGESLEALAEKLDEAMLWVVFNHEFVTNREKEFADLYAELREARNFFRLLGKYLEGPGKGHLQ